MDSLFAPLNFKRGPSMKNRIMLAPLTNSQSHEDGVLSEDEFNWLTMRAKGGFGLTMTCAAHVQAHGKGFPGQLGVFDNKHIEGLQRLADGKGHGTYKISGFVSDPLLFYLLDYQQRLFFDLQGRPYRLAGQRFPHRDLLKGNLW